ncbi:MAG: hypothetical protein AVDCRST_MAG77-2710, partial [uncultured Chloroflexi bacterium]
GPVDPGGPPGRLRHRRRMVDRLRPPGGAARRRPPPARPLSPTWSSNLERRRPLGEWGAPQRTPHPAGGRLGGL